MTAQETSRSMVAWAVEEDDEEILEDKDELDPEKVRLGLELCFGWQRFVARFHGMRKRRKGQRAQVAAGVFLTVAYVVTYVVLVIGKLPVAVEFEVSYMVLRLALSFGVGSTLLLLNLDKRASTLLRLQSETTLRKMKKIHWRAAAIFVVVETLVALASYMFFSPLPFLSAFVMIASSIYIYALGIAMYCMLWTEVSILVAVVDDMRMRVVRDFSALATVERYSMLRHAVQGHSNVFTGVYVAVFYGVGFFAIFSMYAFVVRPDSTPPSPASFVPGILGAFVTIVVLAVKGVSVNKAWRKLAEEIVHLAGTREAFYKVERSLEQQAADRLSAYVSGSPLVLSVVGIPLTEELLGQATYALMSVTAIVLRELLK